MRPRRRVRGDGPLPAVPPPAAPDPVEPDTRPTRPRPARVPSSSAGSGAWRSGLFLLTIAAGSVRIPLAEVAGHPHSAGARAVGVGDDRPPGAAAAGADRRCWPARRSASAACRCRRCSATPSPTRSSSASAPARASASPSSSSWSGTAGTGPRRGARPGRQRRCRRGGRARRRGGDRLVLAVSRRVASPATVLIIGLMAGYAVTSVVSVLIYSGLRAVRAGPRVHRLGVRQLRGDHVGQLAVLVPVVLVGLLLALAMTKQLNALLLGDRYASSMGLTSADPAARHRGRVAARRHVTAFCGPIAFIGVAVPHSPAGSCAPPTTASSCPRRSSSARWSPSAPGSSPSCPGATGRCR
jgi:hypothetical protein